MWVVLLSVGVAVGALAGSVWLMLRGEVTGVERILVVLVSAILALVAWFCIRLEFRGPAKPAVARTTAPSAAVRSSVQNPATGSHAHAST